MMKNLIGINFREVTPAGIPRVRFQDRYCHFIGRARQGDTFYVCRDDISCPLARFYLGIGHTGLKNLADVLIGWNDSINQEVALKYLSSAQVLEACQKYITYFPYPQNDLSPDVIVKIGTADEIMNIVQKLSSLTGMRISASLSGIGAACGECTAYPLVTGEANVSVGCTGSRPGARLKEGELFLAFPANSKIVEIC